MYSKFPDTPPVKTAGEELGFIRALKRARVKLAYGTTKSDAMEQLIHEGVQADIAYFAVIGATI